MTQQQHNNTSDNDMQALSDDELASLMPDPPLTHHIPPMLKAHDQWTTWAYQVDELGQVNRVQMSENTHFDAAVEHARANNLGIALDLKGSAFVAIALQVDEYHPHFQDVLEFNSYFEENDTGDGYTCIVIANIETPRYGNEVKIFNHTFIPITGKAIVKQNPQNLQPQLEAFMSWAFKPTFMDDIPPNATIEMLSYQLDLILSLDDWDADPKTTRLYEFLALCWVHEELKDRILRKLETSYKSEDGTLRYTSSDRRKTFIKIIERYIPKPKPKGIPDEDGRYRKSQKSSNIVRDDELDDASGKPQIMHDPTNLTSCVDATIQALLDSQAPLWQRDGLLVSVMRTPRDGHYGLKPDIERLRIVPVSTLHIVELATQSAHHLIPYKYEKNKQYFRPSACPERTIKILESRMRLPFAPIAGVVTVPTLRADGSVIDQPGYDAISQLFYEPYTMFPDQSDQPTLDDAKQALDALREVFCDVWFAAPCHESAALAAILTIMTRHLYNNAPMLAITSSTRGIGKSNIAIIASIIATGNIPAFSGYGKNEDEAEKQFLVIGMNGDKVIVYDNEEGFFGGKSLDRVLTGQYMKGRILGLSKDVEVKIQATFFVTGNNLKYKGDATRRVLPITIESRMQNPEERTNFRHPKWVDWVTQEQPRLHHAALTLLRAYMAAGKPSQGLAPYGSFEGWSELIRDALVWVGMPDPCEGRREIEDDADIGFEDLQALLHAWHAAYPDGKLRPLQEIVEDAKQEDKGNAGYTPNEKLIDLGKALTAYDIRSNGKISEINVRRLTQRLPVTNGQSRIIDTLRLISKNDAKLRKKIFGIQELKEHFNYEIKNDTDKVSESEPDSNMDLSLYTDPKCEVEIIKNEDSEGLTDGFIFDPGDDNIPF